MDGGAATIQAPREVFPRPPAPNPSPPPPPPPPETSFNPSRIRAPALFGRCAAEVATSYSFGIRPARQNSGAAHRGQTHDRSKGRFFRCRTEAANTPQSYWNWPTDNVLDGGAGKVCRGRRSPVSGYRVVPAQGAREAGSPPTRFHGQGPAYVQDIQWTLDRHGSTGGSSRPDVRAARLSATSTTGPQQEQRCRRDHRWVRRRQLPAVVAPKPNTRRDRMAPPITCGPRRGSWTETDTFGKNRTAGCQHSSRPAPKEHNGGYRGMGGTRSPGARRLTRDPTTRPPMSAPTARSATSWGRGSSSHANGPPGDSGRTGQGVHLFAPPPAVRGSPRATDDFPPGTVSWSGTSTVRGCYGPQNGPPPTRDGRRRCRDRAGRENRYRWLWFEGGERTS